MKPCEHLSFHSQTAVGRISAIDGGPVVYFCAEIEIHCTDCGEKFDFIGLPMGLSAYRPTVNLEGNTLCAPIMPTGKVPPQGLPGYVVRMNAEENVQ